MARYGSRHALRHAATPRVRAYWAAIVADASRQSILETLPEFRIAIERQAVCSADATRRYGEQMRSARKSVMKPWPGACVIISSGLAASADFCGVTPQAQNTGIVPLGIRATGGP